MPDIEIIGGVTLNYDYYDDKDKYSDGDDVEEFILNVFKEQKDISKVLEDDNRWEILCHLSPKRANILETILFSENDEVLEIGSGFGAITEPLSKKVKQLDCIELSKRRSMANAYRNQERSNIKIFIGNFEEIHLEKKYDAILLIGVLEYAQYYISADNPFQSFLQKVYDLLKPDGRVYIAIENRLGMKYFAGAPEDHLGVPYCSVEGYQNVEGSARTFSRSELNDLLHVSGFSSAFFYYPYPDYKFPVAIYSDAYLPQNSEALPASPVYDRDSIRSFDEQNAMSTLFGTEEFKYFSNSYLVEGTKEFRLQHKDIAIDHYIDEKWESKALYSHYAKTAVPFTKIMHEQQEAIVEKDAALSRLTDVNQEYIRVSGSKIWRLAVLFWRLSSKIAPQGSKRRHVLSMILHAGK